ncbi:MAG: hypothetical protein AAFR96_04420 [Planctomycetota bacterium]
MGVTPRDRSAALGSRLGWTAAGTLLSIGIAVLINVLASSHAFRLDVTATGRLALSPRTVGVLERSQPGTEIVLAADLSGRTRPGVQVRRVLDVLEEIDRRSDALGVSVIDTSSASGLASFERLVVDLAARDEAGVAAAASRTMRAAGSVASAEQDLLGLAEGIEALRGGVGREQSADLAARASRLRATADQIGPMREGLGTLMSREIAGVVLPDLAAARDVLVESADAVRTLLRVVADSLIAIGGDGSADEETRLRAADLADRCSAVSDRLGSASASLQSAALPGVVRVVGALTSSEALLVLGPAGGGVAAVSLDDLFPASAPGAPVRDPGRRAESLVTNALVTLVASDRPLVVVVHGGTRRVLAGGADAPFASLRRRSGLRGVEWVEWPVAMEPERPGATAAAAADGRPVVYAVIGIDTSAAGGVDRSARTADVLRGLIDSGERVLVNLAPSTLPGTGQADQMADAVSRLGLEADTGRPVLRETGRGAQRRVDWEQTLVPTADQSAAEPGQTGLASSVEGLGVLLPWPSVIGRQRGGVDASFERLIPVEGVDRAWREGEWLGYWVTPASQRPMLREKPTPGGTRDGEIVAGGDPGDVAFAWAVDRGDLGRAIVVGSHLWMFDSVADRPAVVDGRIVQQHPGNAELFLAGVEWLAGSDELLGRGAAALETPTVQPIADGRLALLRWLLIGGLPVGVLLIGVGVRVVGG